VEEDDMTKRLRRFLGSMAFAGFASMVMAGCAAESADDDDFEDDAVESDEGEVEVSEAALGNNHRIDGTCRSSRAALVRRAATACQRMKDGRPIVTSFLPGVCSTCHPPETPPPAHPSPLPAPHGRLAELKFKCRR
jgi:hypothetical protein